ncbi:MAG: hypothetical protein IPJ56_02695 [Gemmatimonadetes bacterium]|nr:hypothetical protein [Gemmatimonadota bacterium]
MNSTSLSLAVLARDIGKPSAPRILGSGRLLSHPFWTGAELRDLAAAIRAEVDKNDAMEDPIAIEGELPTWVLAHLSCALWPSRLLVPSDRGTSRLVDKPHRYPGGFGRGMAWNADLRAEYAVLEIKCADDSSPFGFYLAPELRASGLLILRASSPWLAVCHTLAYRSEVEAVAIDEGPLGVLIATSKSSRYAVGELSTQ